MATSMWKMSPRRQWMLVSEGDIHSCGSLAVMWLACLVAKCLSGWNHAKVIVTSSN
jgi:hypothetical protein